MLRDDPEFTEHSRRERGRTLTGRYAHYCRDWDSLTIDETCPEWPCECGIKEYVDMNERPSPLDNDGKSPSIE